MNKFYIYITLIALTGANQLMSQQNSRGNSNFSTESAKDPDSIANAIYVKANLNTGIGTANPDSSAALDITSGTKGFLPPRMTKAEMYAISDPAEGLIVYCTDCTMNGVGLIAAFTAGSWNTISISDCSGPPQAPAEGSHGRGPSQIIWHWEAVAGATGYLWNSTSDLATAQDMGTFTSKTESGLTPLTVYTRYVWAYNECGHSVPGPMTDTAHLGPWQTCGDYLEITHHAGQFAPVTKTVIYGTTQDNYNHCWITQNLGADHQAMADNDTTEASAGWYWQFNLKQGYKHDGTMRTPNNAWISYINQNSNWQGENDPCTNLLGAGWHMPDYNIFFWWQSSWNSKYKLHSAGKLNYTNGSIVQRGTEGFYWSSTQCNPLPGDYTSAYLFISHPNPSNLGTNLKAYGFPVRCVR